MARTADVLSTNEVLVVEAITNGTYFQYNELPSGTQDGSNDTFTLANTPNPAGSLRLYKNGQRLKAGGEDYTLTGASIVYVTAQIPFASDIVVADYVVSPV